MLRYKPICWFAALLALLASTVPSNAEPTRLNTLQDIFARVSDCWKAQVLGPVNPIEITVIVSFKRDGNILGRPRITYESAEATDDDRLQYRTAVMETLQRCTPLLLTEALGGAVAGRPLRFTFQTRKRQPKPEDRRAWLQPKTL